MGNKKSNKGHSKNAKKENKNRTPSSGSKGGSFEDTVTQTSPKKRKK